jgi:hypothetical protein
MSVLSVIYFAADPLTGRRSHWSVFLADATAPNVGTVHEAQGGLLQMTYGRVENVTPNDNILFRGKAALCEIPHAKTDHFQKVVEDTTLPSSPIKVPKGYVRRDSQDWVKDVIDNLVSNEIIPAVMEKLEQIPRMVMLE